MTIPVKKEPEDLYDNLGVYERCHFGGKPTKYWHENTNNPVCKSCAKKHKVSELPGHGKRIRANKRKLKKDTK